MYVAFGVRNPVYRITRLENGVRVPVTEVPDGTELAIWKVHVNNNTFVVELSVEDETAEFGLGPTIVRAELSDARAAYGAIYVSSNRVRLGQFTLETYRQAARALKNAGYAGRVTAIRTMNGAVSVKRWRS